MTRVRGKVGCDTDQKKPKGCKHIQGLITSLNMCGRKERLEGSRNYSQFHSAHSRITKLFGLFVGGRGGWKWTIGGRKRGEKNVGWGQEVGEKNESGTPR